MWNYGGMASGGFPLGVVVYRCGRLMVAYIVTFNEAGSSNIGDVAINAGLVNCLRGLGVDPGQILAVGLQSGQRVSASPSCPNGTERSEGRKILDRLPAALYYSMWVFRYVVRFLRLRHELKSAKLFIIGGGGIIMDNKSQFATAMAIVALFARLYRIPTACLGVSAADKRGWLSDWLFRFSLRRMNMVFARDDESRATIEKLSGVTCGVCGDFAFSSVQLVQRAAPSLVLINVSSMVSMPQVEYFEWLKRLANAYAPSDIRLFTTGDLEDFELAKKFAASDGRTLVVFHCVQLSDYVGLLQQAKQVFASRLHAGIIALAGGVPCSMLAVGSKQRNFFRSVGLAHCVLEPSMPTPAPGSDLGVSTSELRSSQIDLCSSALRQALSLAKSNGVDTFLPPVRDQGQV